MSGLRYLLKIDYKQMKHHIITFVKNFKNLELEKNDRILQFEKEKYFNFRRKIKRLTKYLC